MPVPQQGSRWLLGQGATTNSFGASGIGPNDVNRRRASFKNLLLGEADVIFEPSRLAKELSAKQKTEAVSRSSPSPFMKFQRDSLSIALLSSTVLPRKR